MFYLLIVLVGSFVFFSEMTSWKLIPWALTNSKDKDKAKATPSKKNAMVQQEDTLDPDILKFIYFLIDWTLSWRPIDGKKKPRSSLWLRLCISCLMTRSTPEISTYRRYLSWKGAQHFPNIMKKIAKCVWDVLLIFIPHHILPPIF